MNPYKLIIDLEDAITNIQQACKDREVSAGISIARFGDSAPTHVHIMCAYELPNEGVFDDLFTAMTELFKIPLIKDQRERYINHLANNQKLIEETFSDA